MRTNHSALLLTALLCVAACSSTDPSPPASSAGAGSSSAGAAAHAGAAPSIAEGGAPAAGGSTTPQSDVHAFSIQFDYRFDRAGYFDKPERRAALEAAAARWSALLTNDFFAVPAGTRLTLIDPEDRTQTITAELSEDIDDLLVFVGTTEALPEGAYGRGGPSGMADSGDSALNKSFVSRQTGKRFQPWAGSISFKGSVDYYFDESPDTDDDVPPDQFDFISLASHELGHVLGFTASAPFSALETAATFTGKTAVAEYGAPVPLTPDLSHLADGTESHGVEALMTPRLPKGVRQLPTPLDLAALEDIGYVLNR